MNDDFEDRLKTLLNAQVDATTGPRRPAPAFEPAQTVQTVRHRFRPWVVPLAAAVAVVVVGGGTVGAARLLADHRHVPTMTTGPSPAPTSPLDSQSTAPLTSSPTSVTNPPTKAASQSSTSPSEQVSTKTGVARRNPPPPADTTVDLGGATISLPAGWVARDLDRYVAPGTNPIYPGWCLTPSSTPVSTAYNGCALTLTQIDASAGNVDVDAKGGYVSNPADCGQTPETVNEQYGDRTLGGRSADWRRWADRCTGTGKMVLEEQYVVPTVPGWILYSGKATDAMDATMARLAADSSLPAETGQVRLMDRGFVRSIHHLAHGVRMTLDRVVLANGKIVDENPQTYTYVISNAVFDQRQIAVGDLVTLQSNGASVTGIS